MHNSKCKMQNDGIRVADGFEMKLNGKNQFCILHYAFCISPVRLQVVEPVIFSI